MLCRANHDGWVVVESSDKTWSTGGRNGKPLQCSCRKKPMNSVKRQITPEDEPPRSEGVHHATGEEWRTVTNSSAKNDAAGPKRKRRSAVGVSGGESKVQWL